MTYVDGHLKARVKPSGFAAHLIDYLEDRVVFSGKRVVDLGCGRGGYALEISRYARDTLMVDREQSEALPAKPGLVFLRWDFETMLPVLRADVVFSKSVLEHLEDPGNYLRAIRQLIGADGLAVIMVPDWKTGYSVFYDDYTHVRPYTPESLTDLLAAHGLGGDVRRFYQVPMAWKHPFLFSIVRRFWWAVRDPDLRCRLRHAAILAIVGA